MKQPLSRDEWKWVILAVLTIIGMCLIFGTIAFIITGQETFFIGSVILATFFIYVKIECLFWIECNEE